MLDADVLGDLFGARPVPVPAGVLRAAADLTWRLHLHPADPGWFDLLVSVPVMDTGRVRRDLGWAPTWTAQDALDDVVAGIGASAGADTPPLGPHGPVDDTVDALATGMGGDDF